MTNVEHLQDESCKINSTLKPGSILNTQKNTLLYAALF